MRPINLVLGAVAILVCASLAEPFPELWRIGLTILVVWCYTGAGNALNDYFDTDIDRINRPGRPIPAGLITRPHAACFALGLFVTGTCLAFPFYNARIILLLTITIILLGGYNSWFKPRPLVGNIVVSLILGLTFIFGGLIFGNLKASLTPAFLAFGFNLVREIIKDIQDLAGDQVAGANTFPIRFGVRATRNLVVVLIILLMGLTPLPFGLRIYGWWYLIALLFTVEIPLLFVLYSIVKDTSARNCARLSAILKIDIICGLAAIFLGRY